VTDADRFETLRRRFLSLGLGEIAAAAIFVVVPFCLPFIASEDAEAAMWFAMSPLIFVLIQAGIYWLIARRHLPGPFPCRAATIYRALRILDPFILFGCAIGVVGSWPGLSLSAFVAVVVWLFAVAEYMGMIPEWWTR
jgi:hypothetical protein